jgi:outer membrane biosynthesis protein TonB
MLLAGVVWGGCATASARPRETSQGASVDREPARAYLRDHQSEIQRCYERELRQHADLAGRIAVELMLNSQGWVTSAVVKEDTLQSEPVRACILAAVRAWQFPFAPSGESAVGFSWVFKSDRPQP